MKSLLRRSRGGLPAEERGESERYSRTGTSYSLNESEFVVRFFGGAALRGALDKLDKGEAAALFVTRVDRLARSTKDFLSIVDRANQKGWRLVMLDLNLDTSSYQGRFVVTIMSALAEMERSIIADRQKDVHKDRRARGLVWGVDLGPKSKIAPETLSRILEMREKGASYHEIARQLNSESIPTALGGTWHGSTIRKTLTQLKQVAK